jgi:hypothetical protein
MDWLFSSESGKIGGEFLEKIEREGNLIRLVTVLDRESLLIFRSWASFLLL